MKRDSVLVIAEAGVNHNGSLDNALRLIDVARESGADCVKFQTFSAEKLVTGTAEKAGYQKAMTGADETQFAMLKKLELSLDDHHVLLEHCQAVGIEFMSTAFDHDGLDLLVKLGVKRLKVPSGEITNLPYLRRIAGYGLPVIMSTGMAIIEEVGDAVEVLSSAGLNAESLTLLHCTSEYPAAMDHVNLRAMQTLHQKFDLPVGYSDHTLGIEVSIAAVAMGAAVIEKHFTLDKSWSGPDHSASLDPIELKAMVNAIRNIEYALGNGVKLPSEQETETAKVVRRSIVANKPIAKGELLTEDNVTTKRPATGMSPMQWESVIGQPAVREYQKDELI